MTNALMNERDDRGAIDRIILGVAHELNNPNTFVRVNTLNLKKMFKLLQPCLDAYEKEHPEAKFGPYALPELRAKFSQHLESIVEATVRIIAIADKLKQCTADSLENNSEVSLLEIVKDSLRAHEFLMAGSLDVNLSFDEGKAFMVEGHRMQLEQAVSILLTNALDAIAERYGSGGPVSGRLDISLREEGQKVALRVSDNGTGMSSETLGKVFDPYFTTKPQGVGDGLGLPICRSIIGRHGGSVHIQSEEGRGTDVSIEIPKGEDK
jgi:two-component system, NtrC family, sensor kinase